MRAMLAASVALGALVIATGAQAATTIGDKSQPVDTATANNGQPDDITITGTITVKSGTAVTLDSNNSITISGSVNMNSTANGSTGVLVEGGKTGNLTNNGGITLTDGSSRKDTNSDGLADGPWATGENLCAICVAGPGVFTGSITNGTTGDITVFGNDSYGISIGGLPTNGASNVPGSTLTGMVGNFSNTGVIAVTGDRSYGIITTAPITGTVNIAGSVTATGQGAVGVALENNVSGRVTFGGTITATGYSSTTAPTVSATLEKVLATPTEIENSGSAVVIAGNMAHGVLFDTPPTASTSNTDVDGDGVPDASQTASTVTVYGPAPAIAIGSSTQAITLSQVGTTVAASAADYAFGLILKGTVTASGIYSFKPATAIEVGVGDQGVTIQGGIRNSGTITATAIDQAATGLQLDDKAEADLILNSGAITASSTTAVSTDAHDAVAILLKPGSITNTINNSGAISAGLSGLLGNAYAIEDGSGTLKDVENSGSIFAGVTNPNSAPGDEALGGAVALDAHNNTTGVTFHQYQAPTPTGSTTAPAAPTTTGGIFLGTGADTVDIEAGSVTGLIAFGTGHDNLIINNGATVTGGIFQNDGGLSINLTNGTLTDANPGTLNISNLTVGAKGDLVVTIDPTAGTGGFNVSGNATFAAGASLGVRFTSLIQGPTEFDIVKVADPANLSASGINLSSIAANTPYLFTTTAGVNTANGTVFVDVQRRTAAQAQLIPAEAAAFNSFYTALGHDQQLTGAFLTPTTRAGFIQLYDQLLPDHSGAPLLSLASGVDAVSKALSDRRPIAPVGELTGWAQEINFYADKSQDTAFGFHSNGFGVASGLEMGTPVGALGTSLAFTSSGMKDLNAQGDENLAANLVELGFYWRETGPHLRTWVRVAGGYGWFDSTRQFVDVSSTDDVIRKATSGWDGYSLAAAGGMSWEQDFGNFFIRPEVSSEYFYLSENARNESGGGEVACSTTVTTNCGGDGFDLSIGKRQGHFFSATALMNFGGKFGVDGWLQPELHAGWTQYISVDPGVTMARFQSGGLPFALTADNLQGGGPVVGFRILANGAGGFLALEGDADLMKMYKRYQLMIRAGYRF